MASSGPPKKAARADARVSPLDYETVLHLGKEHAGGQIGTLDKWRFW